MMKCIRHPERSSGVALLLVLFAVATATILSLTFIGAQGTATAIAETVKHHAQARFIAEAGMQIAIDHVKAAGDWRSQFASGAWLSDQPLAGGTFSVTGEDGVFDAVTGLIAGDGNLADGGEDPLTITVIGRFEGRTHVVRSVIYPTAISSASGASPHGVNATGSITLKGAARIDALNSSTHNYHPWQYTNTPASIATNATESGKVSLNGLSVIVGNVWVGAGGITSTVIKAPNYHTPITGARQALPAAITVPAVVPPADLPSTNGNSSFPISGDASLNAGTHRYNDFTLNGSVNLTVNGNVVIYCDGTFKVEGTAEIKLAPGATLSVYAYRIEVGGAAQINTSTNPSTPSRVKLYQTSNNELNIHGLSVVSASVLAPSAKLDLNGASRLFGSFHGEAIELNGLGRFTQDLALAEGGGISGGGGGVGGGGTTYSYTTTWSELP